MGHRWFEWCPRKTQSELNTTLARPRRLNGRCSRVAGRCLPVLCLVGSSALAEFESEAGRRELNEECRLPFRWPRFQVFLAIGPRAHTSYSTTPRAPCIHSTSQVPPSAHALQVHFNPLTALQHVRPLQVTPLY